MDRERRLAAARAMWPAAFARADESDRSEETGVDSEGEGEDNGLLASDPEWSDASEESDSSDAASTAHLGHRNPFALDILGTAVRAGFTVSSFSVGIGWPNIYKICTNTPT